MRRWLTLLLVFLVVGVLRGAPPTKEEVRKWLTDLASEKMEGRGTGTRGGETAAAYIESHFRKTGLKPLTNNSYRQNLPVTSLELAGSPEMRINGVLVKDGWSVSVLGGGGDVEGEVVFCGYGVSAPEMGYDDYADVNVKGKIVVVLRGAPGWKSKQKHFRGRSRKHAHLSRKVEVATKQKVAALLIVLGKDGQRIRKYFSPPSVRRGTHKMLPPVLFISPELARRIVGKSVAALARKIDAAFKPFSFLCRGKRINLHIPLVERRRTVCNIVGILQGCDPYLRNRYIVVGAHYDHLGRRGEKIFYGADDNASGTVTVMALAGILSTDTDNRPLRSIIFVCFTGEEMGFVGSSYFVEHPPVPLDKIDIMVNFDMVGRGLPNRKLCFFGASGFKTTRRFAEKAARSAALIAHCTPHPGFRSDHAPFIRKGVPAVFIYCSRNPDYHTPQDTYDKIDYDNLWRVIKAGKEFVSLLADYDGLLTPWRCDGLPRIGVFLEEQNGKLIIKRVLGDSPAAKAGLKTGDQLIKAENTLCKDLESFEQVLRNNKNECLQLEIVRRKEKRNIVLKLPRKRRKKKSRGPRLPIH